MTPTREDIDAHLTARGYRAFPVSSLDRHDRNWQLTYREDGQKRHIDVHEWRHDKPEFQARFRNLPDSFEVHACFDAGPAWVKVLFYSLSADEFIPRLPEIEARLKSLIAQWAVSRDDD